MLSQENIRPPLHMFHTGGVQMSLVQTRKQLPNTFILLTLLAGLAALVLFPQDYVSAATGGLNLCLTVVIPSLFPFFVLSALAVQLDVTKPFNRALATVMTPLFRVGGACAPALVLGLIGGYPVGAKTAVMLYENKACSKAEAERLLCFCNNSGPAFIFGVIGAGIFSSTAVGLLLYISHALSAIIVGILFRYLAPTPYTSVPQLPQFVQKVRFSVAYTESVKSAFQTTLQICAFVIFFAVVIRFCKISGCFSVIAQALSYPLHIVSIGRAEIEQLLIGAVELTSGVAALRGSASMSGTAIVLASLMLGWAGLSIQCQVISIVGESALSLRPYLLGKFLQGLISALLTYLSTRFILPQQHMQTFLPSLPTLLQPTHLQPEMSIVSLLLLLLPVIALLHRALKQKIPTKKR